MVTKNLKLDLAKIKKAQGKGDAGRANIAQDQWSTGTVAEALDNGLVAVELDNTDDGWPPVVAPADAGVTAIGASVRVIRDSTGRITHVAAPDSLPEDSTPLYVGSTGAFVKGIADAQVELDSAIAGATADAAAAQSAAQSAANDAAAAMVDAGEAITVASTKTSVKASKTSSDSPMTNDIWFPLDDAGNVIGMKQWTGSSWVDYRLMAGSIVVPGSVGNVLLENGAVSAEKIFANEALWAKIATFASVTTDMLLAGGATITGTLLADVITLASRLVAGDPEGGRTELDSTGLHVFQGSTEKVRVSASALNGLQVWNPAMNAMVDLASSAFGTQILKFDDKVTVPTPGSASAFGEWKPGAWVFQSLGNWTSATNRVQVFSTTSLGDWGVGQSFGVRIAFTMQPVGGGTEIQLTDTGGEYGAVINRASPSPNFNIVNCDPGVEYSIRLQAQAIRYQGTSGGTPWIKNSRISLAPI